MATKLLIFAPTLAAVAAVLLFSTGGLAVKWLPLSALPLSGIRSLIAAIFFFFYMAVVLSALSLSGREKLRLQPYCR